MVAEYVFCAARLDQSANQLEGAEVFRSAIDEIASDPKGEFIAEGSRRTGNEFLELDSAALHIADENSLHSAFRDAPLAPLSPSSRRDSTADRFLRFHSRSSLRPLDNVAGHARFRHRLCRVAPDAASFPDCLLQIHNQPSPSFIASLYPSARAGFR